MEEKSAASEKTNEQPVLFRRKQLLGRRLEIENTERIRRGCGGCRGRHITR